MKRPGIYGAGPLPFRAAAGLVAASYMRTVSLLCLFYMVALYT